VSFKPNATTKAGGLGKYKPDAIVGVFAGYELKSGYEWKGEYLVWPLESFVKAELSKLTTHLDQTLKHPQAVKQCWLYRKGEIEFPLKEEYDRLNGILSGLKESHQRFRANDPEHAEEAPPPAPPPDGSGIMDPTHAVDPIEPPGIEPTDPSGQGGDGQVGQRSLSADSRPKATGGGPSVAKEAKTSEGLIKLDVLGREYRACRRHAIRGMQESTW
jgi:hypothetical protein